MLYCGMKILYSLIILTLLSSCLYTKNAAVSKFCSQKTADTTIVIRDTLVLDSTHTDTVFSSRIDSIYIEKGKLSIKYIKVRDSIYLTGKYDADTIIRTDTVRISIPILTNNCTRTWFERIKDARNWLIFAFMCGVLLGLYLHHRY